MVLLLKEYDPLGLPFAIPEGLKIPHRNLVILVDDIDHYCVGGSAVAEVEGEETPAFLAPSLNASNR